MSAYDEKLTLVIGDKNFSSWSMRPWLALRATALPFEEKKVLLDFPTTAQEIRRYSPSARVPVLLHGSLNIWDSLAISEYLSELAPKACLWPDSREHRAHARSIVAEMHSGFEGLRRQLSMDLRLRIEINHLTADTIADIRRVVAIWTECLNKSKGPFLFGKFSIADSFYAPVVMRFYSYGIAIKDNAVLSYMRAIRSYPHLQEWIAEAEKEQNAKVTF